MPVTQTEIKKIKALRTKKGRKKHNRYIAEGSRLLRDALKWHVYPENVFYAPDMISEEGAVLIDDFNKSAIAVEKITSRQMKGLSDTVNSQGIIGVFALQEYSPGELSHEMPRKILLCNGISDPGNLGTLIRSAAAFDFHAVLVDEFSAEPYNPKVVRSSAGAIFAVTVTQWPLERILTFFDYEDYYMMGADVKGEEMSDDNIGEHQRFRIVLAIGSEAVGLSEEVRSQCRVLWRIGHKDKVESLNAAVAGSILMNYMYEW